MDKGIVTWILIAMAVLVTIGGVGYGMSHVKQAKTTGNIATKEHAKLQGELSDAEYDAYDGTVISGSEVINVVKKFEDESVSVKVITKKSTAYYGYSLDANNELKTGSTSSPSKMQDITSPLYVNPSGNFTGSLLKDSNDVITGICFTQE